MERGGCVYILTNYQRTALYIGVTSNLPSRLIEHNTKHFNNSFSAKYNLSILVYYEALFDIEEAISREKQLKRWSRTKKDYLINENNKEWKDLSEVVFKW